MFKSLSLNDKEITWINSLIKNSKDYTFTIFINDYSTSAIDFNILFIFLYIKFFSRYFFKSIYLLEVKTYLFSTSINLLEFSKSILKLILVAKH